jgi:hypothetical protein
MISLCRRSLAILSAASVLFATTAMSPPVPLLTSDARAVFATPLAEITPPYGRPNAMTCVANSVIVWAPTSVPVVGPVTWQMEMLTYDATNDTWNEKAYLSPEYTNVADRVQVTAGPWSDPQGNAVWETSAVIGPGAGRVLIQVYNHFYAGTGANKSYVGGWFSTVDGTATGDRQCVLDDGPIVVGDPPATATQQGDFGASEQQNW